MLDIILKTLIAYQVSDKVSDKNQVDLTIAESSVFDKLVEFLAENVSITTATASQLLGKSTSSTRRYLAKFVKVGLLETSGENKNRKYSLKKSLD